MQKDVIDVEDLADKDYQDEFVDDEYEENEPYSDDTDKEDEIIDDEFDDDIDKDNPPNEDDDEETPNDDDDLGFSFDDEEESEEVKQAPKWVKEVRIQNRELKRKLKEYEAKQAQSTGMQALREKPTLEEYDYDDEAYQADLDKWYQEKQQFESHKQQVEQQFQQVQEKFNAEAQTISAVKPDFQEKLNKVAEALPIERQNFILGKTKNPAKLSYLLGKSPEKLAQLAELDDIDYIKQIGVLEYQMQQGKTKQRNPNKPKPRKHKTHSSGGGVDMRLQKLQEQAEKTGNYTEVIRYKKQMKQGKK